MKLIFVLFYSLFFLIFNVVHSQTSPVTGLRDNTPGVYALTNVRIVKEPGNIIDRGTLVIRDGIVESAGRRVKPPGDAWLVDMAGRTIYPGFIDMWVETGFSNADTDSYNGARHWNTQVRSWFDAASYYMPDDEKVKRLRSEGFVLANAVPPSGIFHGNTAIVSLGKGETNKLIVKPEIAQVISFEKTPELGGNYPTSLMGVVSLIRQTFHDASWYHLAHSAYRDDPRGMERPELNLALESLISAGRGQQPVLFGSRDEKDFIRAQDIASEFGLNLWVRGSGHEYRRLDVVRNSEIPLVLPIDFPDVPDIDTPEEGMEISLETLRHWDLAPENPGILHNAGVKIALTSYGLKDNSSFLDQLRLAVTRGLDKDAALESLTSVPSLMLGLDNQYGSIARGKVASFIITDGDLFNPQTQIEEVWIDGEPFEINKPSKIDVRGSWEIVSHELGDINLEIYGNDSGLSGSVNKDDYDIALSSVKFDNYRLSLVMRGNLPGLNGIIRLSASVSEKELYGIGEMSDGSFINWKGLRLRDDETDPENHSDPDCSFDNNDPADDKVTASGMSGLRMIYPSMEYGVDEVPESPANLIIKNTKIWTQGPQGILENADMLIQDGKITNVGYNIQLPENAVIIDAKGKQITPGIVDPHLHTSIRGGVNEVGINMTPETRIKDVIEPDNIWVYRLLAGGVTTANLLHGSANPVGGQDAVVKMRWGSLPQDMILRGAKPGLKLALGENVVRNPGQYPNTRMGTEQIIRDAFQAAKDYQVKWSNWEIRGEGLPPRKDLQMEALVEVLNGDRIIHAHAYRQDEMQMLMRLAGEMGFRIASFEHTVEGYKIADILRDHGAGAIVWTDWSSFKVEAADAIQYNARILHEQGVLTALHSDNTQLSTRMNWEAGKMLATGIDEIAAMDMITINPARILGADDMVGSLEPGKHADFVIWSGHPLSGFTHAEQTWIDGRKYFDRQDDLEKREKVREERALLIQKAASLSQKPSGKSGS